MDRMMVIRVTSYIYFYIGNRLKSDILVEFGNQHRKGEHHRSTDSLKVEVNIISCAIF